MPYLFRVTCQTCDQTIDVNLTRFTVMPDGISVTWQHCDAEQSQPFDPAHVDLILRRGGTYDPGITNDDIAAFRRWLDDAEPGDIFDLFGREDE